MQGCVGPIEALAIGTCNFRRVLLTAGHIQSDLMALQPGEEIGSEVHATHDQFFRIEKGHGEIRIDSERSGIKAGNAIVVPAGMRHNLITTGKWQLRLQTLNAPPHHTDRLIEATKAIADSQEAERAAVGKAEKGRTGRIDKGSQVTKGSK